MDPEYLKFRDVRTLHDEELKSIVVGILATDPATGAYSALDCERVIDELLSAEIGKPESGKEGAGYHQVLTTLTSAFLRLAGANITVIKNASSNRNKKDLERLLESIRRRLIAKNTPVIAKKTPETPDHNITQGGKFLELDDGWPSAPTTFLKKPVFQTESKTKTESNSANPARSFLESIVDQEVAHVSHDRRNSRRNATRNQMDSTVPAANRTLASVGTWTRLGIATGIELHVRSDQTTVLSDPERRKMLTEQIVVQIQRLYGDHK